MFEIFSTREMALMIWSSIFIIVALLIVKFKDVFDLLRKFFDHKIQIPLWGMFFYIAAITFGFYKVDVWNMILLKDTILWSLTSATILFFNMNKAKESSYFMPIIIDNLKAVIPLEFITNFYNFSFGIEMTIIPVMTFIGVMQIAAENSARTNADHLKTASCLKGLFAALGILIFIYVCYKTAIDYKSLMTVENLKSLFLPVVYTFLLLPFLYLLALYMNYEVLFIRLPYLIENKKERLKMKLNILLLANVNLKKLHKISTNLNFATYTGQEIKKSLKKILKEPN
ncbi:hypothetical protein K6T82_11295 [Flavobacterium sp. 17A]|uniref:Uncharacterized protein n=1 Tax=Flavobacterium potami TaxID=2872310 RepID=A0A9X1HAY6_9FLAO|nr:hypothetical protein [Flavobacterium potami]MBZ4035353.1 hypothetical protein [Flavobacterium potami]